jgi:YaaC-like Protein
LLLQCEPLDDFAATRPMIIATAAKIQNANPAQYAWFSLRRFHNVRFTAERISKIHQVPAKHVKNVEKQADQIRFFLIQAKEYFDASKTVTLVTRPVLLYYSAMCLATAEILFKHSGDSSLDCARDKHKHHGLTFVNKHSKRTIDKITLSAAGLRAKPAIRANQARYGTFELWHQTAREPPMPADIINRLPGSGTIGYGAVVHGEDSRLGYLPECGVTLLDVMKCIPGRRVCWLK